MADVKFTIEEKVQLLTDVKIIKATMLKLPCDKKADKSSVKLNRIMIFGVYGLFGSLTIGLIFKVAYAL